MNWTEIQRVEAFDFLCVTLDENLTWKSHTDEVATKLSKYSGIINKLKNYLPPHILKALYNSLVQPNLNFAILVLGYKCNRLVKLQKRLVRIITRSKYNAHTDPLVKRTETLKVANTLDLNALKFYYKYLHGKLPSYLYSFNIVTQGSQHTYNTRQSEQIRTESTRAEYCNNRLRIYLPGLVNSAPLHLLERIATHSIQGFSFGIKYHFLNSYPTECSSVNCHICHRIQREMICKFLFLTSDEVKVTSRHRLRRLGGHRDSPNGQPYRGCCCLIFIGYCYIFMFLYLYTDNYNSCITRKPVHYTCGSAVAGRCRPGIGPRRFASDRSGIGSGALRHARMGINN